MLFCCSTEFGGGLGAVPFAPSHEESFANRSPGEGASYLEIPDDAEIRVRPYNPYRAKMSIPCTHGRCPGRMHLCVNDDRNYYECDQDGLEGSLWRCPNATTRTYPEDIRTSYVMSAHRAKPGLKSNEEISPGELETAL